MITRMLLIFKYIDIVINWPEKKKWKWKGVIGSYGPSYLIMQKTQLMVCINRKGLPNK